MTRRFTAALLALAATCFPTLLVTAPAPGHETDQYTLPRRDFADLGPYLNSWFYDAIEGGVKKVNDRIAAARKGNRLTELQRLQSDGEIVRAVNSEFPNAMSVIEGLDSKLGETAFRAEYPGRVLGYKESFTNIYEHAHFILDPRQLFRVWLAKTFVAYGVHMGGDKIGHFTDMGMNYWRAYDSARNKGANEEEATVAAVKVGTQGLIFSEKGMLGYLSAGSYSNGDMVANYLGFVFYRNLTAPMMLKGKQQPAMLVREGDFWKFAPHVRRDNDFFAVFLSDHFDEALNPSHYEGGMRGKIREAIKERQSDVLERFADENGLRRPMAWFEAASRECRTYFGVDYGHRGPEDELNSISRTCFDPLPNGASPNDRNDRGYTALHDAVIRGDLARVAALIKAGADVNAAIRSAENYSSDWGATPLHLAARDGRRDIVEALLKAGAKATAADDRGATPLHWSVGYPEMVAVLINAGADPNAADRTGRTAMHWAANLKHGDTADALAKRGGNAGLADRSGITPLHLAAHHGDTRTIIRLIENGASVSAADRYGRTPLHEVAIVGDAEPVNALLSRGASVSAADLFGVTPLHEACRMGRTATVQALLGKGASPTAADLSGVTPLHLAARGGHESAVTAMLAHGANANARSASGMSPLHEAAFSGRASIISALTAAGSDRSTKDTQGRTPRDIAQVRGHKQLLALLASASGSDVHADAGAM